MGSAYIFNTGSSGALLYINQAQADALPGPMVTQRYVPTFAEFPFNPGGGNEATEFGAQTLVGVRWEGGGASQTYQVNLPSWVSGDIRLYLFNSHAVLCWESGEAVLTPAAGPPAPSESGEGERL